MGCAMLRRLAIAIIMVCASLASPVSAWAAAASPAPVPLRVLLLNIQHGANSDGQLQLEALAAFLKEQRADVVVLNEVQRRRSESSYADEAQFLRRKLGLSAAVNMNANLWPSGHGNLLLSRFPIVDVRRHYLPGEGEQRGLLEAGLNVSGYRVTLLVTHLAPAKAPREVQADYISRRATEIPGPKILVGDLNAPPNDSGVTALIAGIGGGAPTPAPTYPSHNPRVRADYILPDRNFRLRAESIPAVLVSDHLPVITDLTFLPAGPPAYPDDRPSATVDLTVLPPVPPVSYLRDPATPSDSVSISLRREESAGWRPEITAVRPFAIGNLGLRWSGPVTGLSWSRRLASGDLRDLDSYHPESGRYLLSAEAAADFRAEGPFSAGLAYTAALSDGAAQQLLLRAVLDHTTAARRGGRIGVALGLNWQWPYSSRLAVRTGFTLARNATAQVGVIWEAGTRSTWSADLYSAPNGGLGASVTHYF